MIIYATINLINHKWYVGQDSHDNPRYQGSGVILRHAIKKYGVKYFKKFTLQCCKSKKELDLAEKFWIRLFTNLDETSKYNIALGGEGQAKGTKLTEDTKRKISFAQSLEGYVERLGESRGRFEYERRRLRCSKAHTKRFKDPLERLKYSCPAELNPMYGKKHSQMSKMKIAQALQGRRHSSKTISLYKSTRKGSNNGMYGKGSLVSGSRNGRTLPWRIVTSEKLVVQVTDGLQRYCTINNLSYNLLRRYEGRPVPSDLKIRRYSNSSEYSARKRTLGYKLERKGAV